MKKLFAIILSLSLSLPLVASATDFSQTFLGYANSVPIKLQLSSVGKQLYSRYAYKNNADNTYIPDEHYIFGTNNNPNIFKLDTNPGKPNNVSFAGKLKVIRINGIKNYELIGLWQDKLHLIDQVVTLKQLNLKMHSNSLMVNQFKVTHNAAQHYMTTASYPLIMATIANHLSKQDDSINHSINHFITEQISSFTKATIQGNEALSYSADSNSSANTLDISNVITNIGENFLSIRFAVSEMDYHAAHQNTDFVSLNFNTKTGKLVNLANLFEKNSNFLSALAKLSRPMLIKKLFPNVKDTSTKNPALEWIYEGTKPDAKNYQVWNTYNGNLMLTFPSYQVAAYVYGPQTIMIPFTKLRSIAKPGSVIIEWLG